MSVFFSSELIFFEKPLQFHSDQTQRERNIDRFNEGKLPGNSKHCLKRSKDKPVPGKRSFKR